MLASERNPAISHRKAARPIELGRDHEMRVLLAKETINFDLGRQGRSDGEPRPPQ